MIFIFVFFNAACALCVNIRLYCHNTRFFATRGRQNIIPGKGLEMIEVVVSGGFFSSGYCFVFVCEYEHFPYTSFPNNFYLLKINTDFSGETDSSLCWCFWHSPLQAFPEKQQHFSAKFQFNVTHIKVQSVSLTACLCLQFIPLVREVRWTKLEVKVILKLNFSSSLPIKARPLRPRMTHNLLRDSVFLEIIWSGRDPGCAAPHRLHQSGLSIHTVNTGGPCKKRKLSQNLNWVSLWHGRPERMLSSKC